MPRLFISYRRDDAPGEAGRLADLLRARFGEDQVFIDVDAIHAGDDFPRVIDDELAKCSAILVVVGRTWAQSVDPAGRLRLDDPHDFVRLEVETALRRNVRVVPVLVRGAVLPKPDGLPATLQPLLRRHAFELADAHFRSDVGRLLTSLDGRTPSAFATRWRPWYRLLGVAAILSFASFSVFTIVMAGRSGCSGDRSTTTAMKPGSQDAARVVDGAGAPSGSTSAALDASAASAPAPGKPGDVNAWVRTCADRLSQKQWEALDRCATQLASLGVNDKAKEFHAKANQEADNERKDAKVRKAVRDGNLREAQAVLETIGAESVYSKAIHDVFNAAEVQLTDDIRRKALALANAHDCVALTRLASQQRVTGTERVASAAAVKCTAAPAATAVPRPAVGPGSAIVVPPVRPTPPKDLCDSMNVDDLLAQATSQDRAGSPKLALELVIKALKCRQDVRMYRLAVTYACDARDIATAKLYFAKVPPVFQANLEQRCQQYELNLRGP